MVWAREKYKDSLDNPPQQTQSSRSPHPHQPIGSHLSQQLLAFLALSHRSPQTHIAKMKFTTVALLATGAELALGARLTEKRRANHAAKFAQRANQRHSSPRINAPDVQYNETSHVSYSTNWAGSVYTSTEITGVTGTIVVPTPSAGDAGGLKAALEGYCASAWVGIDGDTCDTAILQTGIDFCYEDGDVSFDAW